MAKKVWKKWTLTLQHVIIDRIQNGDVMFTYRGTSRGMVLAPREAYRLFQKLQGDYRD